MKSLLAITAEGVFKIENASPDNYRFQAIGLPPGLWIKSIGDGARDILNSGLDLSAGASAPIEIVLGVGTGTLTGLVQDAKQQLAPGVFVSLLLDPMKEERNDLHRSVTTDQNGKFNLANIPPAITNSTLGKASIFLIHSTPNSSKPTRPEPKRSRSSQTRKINFSSHRSPCLANSRMSQLGRLGSSAADVPIGPQEGLKRYPPPREAQGVPESGHGKGPPQKHGGGCLANARRQTPRRQGRLPRRIRP